MRVRSFEDLVAWQKAIDLAEIVYKQFRDSKDFGFRDQICRAAVSVSNNIAEGFDRSKADFRRFLNMAHTSCNEVKSMGYLGERLGYISSKEKDELHSKCNEISRVVQGLIKSIEHQLTTDH